jgi:nickel-dependent lactate racemase
MQIDLPYGHSSVRVDIPDHARVVNLEPTHEPVDIRAEIRQALDHPVGSLPLRSLAGGFQDAVIVINDVTRPAPSGAMLEALLEDLSYAGIAEDRVTVVIANGNHRPCTPLEIRQMVGSDLFERLCIINHDAKDSKRLTRVGETKTGLPVWANKIVAKASFKILTGLITPHHSAGYSGGRKSLIPGVAGLETLKRHHSFPFRPFEPAYGWMKGNPFHEEAVRIAKKVGIDFILNVIPDSHGNFFKAVAGDLEAAHEKGVALGNPFWEVSLPHPYDVVIATPGGFPRDIDLHQAQKAVSAAETMIASGGIIVLIAECRDGLGKWEASWLKAARSPQEVIERFQKEGFTEDHTSKDFMCARALAHHEVIICSGGIPEHKARKIFFTPVPSPQDAVGLALERAGTNPRVLVLPRAVNCVPRIDG